MTKIQQQQQQQQKGLYKEQTFAPRVFHSVSVRTLTILGDPGADSGDEGKSKRAEKYIWNEEK